MKQSDITKEHIESIEVHCPLNPDTVIKLPMDQVQCRALTNFSLYGVQEVSLERLDTGRIFSHKRSGTAWRVASDRNSAEDTYRDTDLRS